MGEGKSEKELAFDALNVKLDELFADIRAYYKNFYGDDLSLQEIELIIQNLEKTMSPGPEHISPDVSEMQFRDPNL